MRKADVIKGWQDDEFAVFNPDQAYAKLAIKYSIETITGEDLLITYTGFHNLDNTDFYMLLRAINGSTQAQTNAYRILGDLFRDFNGECFKRTLDCSQMYFDAIN